MREKFIQKNFHGSSLEMIERAQVIIDLMGGKGYRITIRQLYYQFVTRNWLPNTVKSYKRLVSIINDARLAGALDWDSIVDRTRFLRSIPNYNSPREFVLTVGQSYAEDLWRNQANYVETWIEKDALIGVIEGPCDEWRVPYYSCRGYGSQSEMYEAGKRLLDQHSNGKRVTILHLSDHDPSGLDMTNDIRQRLDMFCGDEVIDVRRIALTMDQIDEYNPPPNPAKETDSRFTSYAEQFGNESWELDSLDPEIITELINDNIRGLCNEEQFNDDMAAETERRNRVMNVGRYFRELSQFLETGIRPIE